MFAGYFLMATEESVDRAEWDNAWRNLTVRRLVHRIQSRLRQRPTRTGANSHTLTSSLIRRNTQNAGGAPTTYVPSADTEPTRTVLDSLSHCFHISRVVFRVVVRLGHINRVFIPVRKSLAHRLFLGEAPANKSLHASRGSVFLMMLY